jgi:hypothetical protein
VEPHGTRRWFGGDKGGTFIGGRRSRHSNEAITGMERMGAASMMKSIRYVRRCS